MNEWTLESITAHINTQHEETFSAWKEAHDAYDDPTHEEEFEETLERKYNEGYSDALEMVQGLLPEIARLITEAKKEEGAEVLSYLSDIFEGVEDTDIWGDYFEVETVSCGACGQLVEDVEEHWDDCDENPNSNPDEHFSNPVRPCQLCGKNIDDIEAGGVVIPWGETCGDCIAEIKKNNPNFTKENN